MPTDDQESKGQWPFGGGSATNPQDPFPAVFNRPMVDSVRPPTKTMRTWPVPQTWPANGG